MPDPLTRADVRYERWLDFAQRMAKQAYPSMTEHRKQRLYEEVTQFIEQYADVELPNWDCYVCDDFREFFEVYDERRWESDWPINSFINQACCCIRAGLDQAGSPSAGVLGFTVGDLRRLYDGAIPEWISEQYHGDLSTISDEAGIWL